MDVIVVVISFEDRPDHGATQVKSLSEIKVGGMYRSHSAPEDYRDVFIVNYGPYKDNQGRWWMLVTMLTEIGPFQTKCSLADKGVVAYADGTWNENNWMERIL